MKAEDIFTFFHLPLGEAVYFRDVDKLRSGIRFFKSIEIYRKIWVFIELNANEIWPFPNEIQAINAFAKG
jgi:hypothetical protein